ncbi:Sec7 domain-containing protein ARFGEF [Plasmodium brasilianum]|uniref:Sec7 domain-containing protein ARFGEF n=1 Tax=Plasmodium brasilianum TaxID=5824 RepID=A0ACB9Y7T3_PLABR|nr:Sec7 domain-containing protein ARFGEF [Plasmodium brasilianum]
MEKSICFKNAYKWNGDNKKNLVPNFLSNEFSNDEYTKLNIFTIIKNEIINVLSVIKKQEYNKNLDSSIVDALFILYNSINNLNYNIKEGIEVPEFNNKLDIYHIAPFLNIIRNNNIFYKIKLNALHSLDHILKYNSIYLNEKTYDKTVSSKKLSYISSDNNEYEIKNDENYYKRKKYLTNTNENSVTKVSGDKHVENDTQLLSKTNEKIPKRKKYNFFSKNYKLTKKFSLKKEENPDFILNKGNNIINISIETLLSAPMTYSNINHEEIILYDTIILFNNILCNSMKVVDRKNIIKIICYIFKIYKNNKYSLLFKGNCESVLKNIFYVVMSSVMSNGANNGSNDNVKKYVNNNAVNGRTVHSGTMNNNTVNNNAVNNSTVNNAVNKHFNSTTNSADDDFIQDILSIVLILINSNKSKFIVDLLKTKECINLNNDLFENEISNDNLECINMLSFRLLNILLETCGYSLINKNFDALCNIIRCLFLHMTSSSYILMCRSMRTYINMFILYKKHFFIYNEIFINILLNILKKSSAKNVIETALLTLSYFCIENVLFEIYYNHDVNLYAFDVLENFVQSILSLCVNFIQNTTIMNEIIFKMIKNILYILIPYITSNTTTGSNNNNNNNNRNSINSVNESTSRMYEIGYTNQIITEFRNDLYSNTFGYVINSRKKRKVRNTIEKKNGKEQEEETQQNKKKEIMENKNVAKLDNVNELECKSIKGHIDEITENVNKKNACKSGEGVTEEVSDNKGKSKKSNMNELYTLNFLTSSKDKSYIVFCSMLLFEHLKGYHKVYYIKNKQHLMRKKKNRKEILKKSATIFNTLKNKSIDELIKMNIIQTKDSLNQIDKNNYILDSVMAHENENLIVHSNSSVDEKCCIAKEVDTEKANNHSGSMTYINSVKNNEDSTKISNNNSRSITYNGSITNNPKDGEQEKSADTSSVNHTSAVGAYNDERVEEENDKDESRNDHIDNNCENETCENNYTKETKDTKDAKDAKSEFSTNVQSSGSTNINYNYNGTIEYDHNKDDEVKVEEENNKNTELSKEENDIEIGKEKKNNKQNQINQSGTANEECKITKTNSKGSCTNNVQKNLMEDEHFLKSIAKFLRYNPFLDKEFVGEYISHRKNINILKSYVKLFDFCNLSLLSSLRLFLHCFKLPGEAQLIERILEHFSLCFFYSNPIYGNVDLVYKMENDKVVCLSKEEELANTKRYILIDFLNDNMYEGSSSSSGNGYGNNNDANDSTTALHNNSNKDNSSNGINNVDIVYSQKNKFDGKSNIEYDSVQEKINLKKDVDINDYIHKNVYSISKKVQLMKEEEVQKKYVIVENSDVIFILTYSIIMLNTDLHNNQVKNKMKLEEFIKNNRGINNGKNIDRIYLENLYNCILHEEIKLFSNTQNSYTNDNQYWKLLEKRKEQYKKYHCFKMKEVYFYKFDINKLLIKNNFIPIFFEIFKRTSDYSLIENCLCIFKVVINTLAYYHDLENINKLCYIFKYINFYLTQKSQSLLYLLFHFVKKCHNLFRDGWIIYINIIFKLITIDLIPIFFYPHMYINNTQFINEKEFLNKKYKKGNCVETYNINKSITEIYQHPHLVFKKNVKKLNKSKWIDEFSSMFFSRHSNNENKKLSTQQTRELKQTEEENEEEYDDNYEEHDDDDDNNNNSDVDNLNHIYVNIKADPKNPDNSTIIDNVNIYKRLKLDIYNFFTINDFYNNIITNLNISSFMYLIKILMVKCSVNKEKNELNNVNVGNKADLHNISAKVQIPNQGYLTNDKFCSNNNTQDIINDSNPVLVNSDNSFDLFCLNKEKLLTSQMFFHIMYFKINYTYVLYNMICKQNKKQLRKKKKTSYEKLYEEEVNDLTSNLVNLPNTQYNYQIQSEGKENKKNIMKKEEEKKRNKYDLTLNNIYDTDNSTNISTSDSEYSDMSTDSFFIKKNEIFGGEEKFYLNSNDENHQKDQEKREKLKDPDEFDKIYVYADEEQGEELSSEEGEDEKDDEEDEEDEDGEDDEYNSCSEKEKASKKMDYGKKDKGSNIMKNYNKGKKTNSKEIISKDAYLNNNMKRSNNKDKVKEFLMDKIKMNLYMKTYIMHLKITVITFEHFFNLLNRYLLINYDSTIFVNIYNSIFKNFQMENLKFLTEEEISNDDSYHIYDSDFENIAKKLNYKEEKIDVNDVEKNMFLIKITETDLEEDWLFIEQLIMSVVNFSYICFNIYKDDKNKISGQRQMDMNCLFAKNYIQIKKKNNKFFFLCGIYLMYILQFLKKNILYRFIDKIIYVLEKISKNVYVNSCIINIYLHMLQLITPNNILYKNTNNTNISLNDKDIYIYIEKATIYTESINNIINNNSVLLKLNNFNIENIILSLLPYLLYFNNKKEEINAHIASINSECLHIISNIYYKSIYMYMNNSKKKKKKKMSKLMDTYIVNRDDNYNDTLYKKYKDNIAFEKIIELKKMYIFLLTCFVLSLACSFSSKRTRSEAYIKLQQFLFNENYIFKRVQKKEESTMTNNKNEKNSKHDKYVYRDEKLIDLISNFIILPLITYNYYFPFICKNISTDKLNCENEQYKNNSENDIDPNGNNYANSLNAKKNYCMEALLNFNLYNKKSNDISDKMLEKNEYENCGCIINYKNIEAIDQDINVLNNLFNYANDYYIHTMLHKQYNYYFSYLYAKKMLTYDNVCYRKSMSISFVSHIILSFLYSLLNCSGDSCDIKRISKNDTNMDSENDKNEENRKRYEQGRDSFTQNDEINNKYLNDLEEECDINLYELLCLNNERICNKILTKTKCENNCIFYFLKHFYCALLTIQEEAKKILNIYKETFVENIKNIIYVSSSYAYSLKDHRINCFSHIKNGYSFLNEEEKKHLKPYNAENVEDKNNLPNDDNEIFKSISKLQVNVRISIVIVYYILYSDNSQNDQFKNIFEELLNVLLTKYDDGARTQADCTVISTTEKKTEDEKEQAHPGNIPNESADNQGDKVMGTDEGHKKGADSKTNEENEEKKEEDDNNKKENENRKAEELNEQKDTDDIKMDVDKTGEEHNENKNGDDNKTVSDGNTNEEFVRKDYNEKDPLSKVDKEHNHHKKGDSNKTYEENGEEKEGEDDKSYEEHNDHRKGDDNKTYEENDQQKEGDNNKASEDSRDSDYN